MTTEPAKVVVVVGQQHNKNNKKRRIVVTIMLMVSCCMAVALFMFLVATLHVMGGWQIPPATLTSLSPTRNVSETGERSRWIQANNDEEEEEPLLLSFPTTTTTTLPPIQLSSSSSSRVLVCGMDGFVQMLDAMSGQRIGNGFGTLRPLLTTATVVNHHNNKKDDDDKKDATTSSSGWHVVPSWDGYLYFIPLSSSKEDDAADGAPTFPSMAPLSIPHLLQHPVQTCTSAAFAASSTYTTTTTASSPFAATTNHHPAVDCGILTATKVTSLWAIDATTGELKWHRTGSGGATTTSASSASSSNNSPPLLWQDDLDNDSSSSSSSSTTTCSLLLLQREDYLIQQVSVLTGQVQWNVSVADYQALDFPTAAPAPTAFATKSNSVQQYYPTNDDNGDESFAALVDENHDENHVWLSKDKLLLPKSDDTSRALSSSSLAQQQQSQQQQQQRLPFISFEGEQSQTLLAFDDANAHRILWKLQLNQTIASVFGINSLQQWASLQVIVPPRSTPTGEPRDAAFATTTTHYALVQVVPANDNNINNNNIVGLYDKDAANTYTYPSRQQLLQFTSSQQQDDYPNYDKSLSMNQYYHHGHKHHQRFPPIQYYDHHVPRLVHGEPQRHAAATRTTTQWLQRPFMKQQQKHYESVPLKQQQYKYLPSPSNHEQVHHHRLLDSVVNNDINSKALVTIPSAGTSTSNYNPFDHDDVYYDYFQSHYRFLQDFYNQQQHQITKHPNQQQQQQSDSSGTLLLLTSPTHAPPPPPPGLLVMSRMTASVLILLWLVLWGIGGRWWYLRKKQQWLDEMDAHATTDVPTTSSYSNSSSGGDDTAALASSSNSVCNNSRSNSSNADDYNENVKNNGIVHVDGSLTPTAMVTQSDTTKYDGGDDHAVVGDTVAAVPRTSTSSGSGGTSSGNATAATSNLNHTNVAMKGGGTILVDGIIPLLRYSRYKSEFRQMEHLGRGGFGSVVRCQNVLDGREYAIKKISIVLDDVQDEEDDLNKSNKKTKRDIPISQQLHRVLREVKSLALLDHVNIVRYYTAWLEHGDISVEDDPDERQQQALESYYLASDHNDKHHHHQRNNKHPILRSWMETSSSFFTNATKFQRRLSGSNWRSSELVKSTTDFGRSDCSNDHRNINDHNNNDDDFTDHGSSSWEDYGFTFQRSEGGASEVVKDSQSLLSAAVDLPAVGNTGGGSNDDSHSTTQSLLLEGPQGGSQQNSQALVTSPQLPLTNNTGKRCLPRPQRVKERKSSSPAHHTLYIQMQLCSQKTLADFLANPEARRGPFRSTAPGCIDIPHALALFHQVAQGVQHVHRQGLIHRDLKPNNCFIDEGGVVKVGDFGLSREASSSSRNLHNNDQKASKSLPSYVDEEFNTAGVGTRSYASPEQMNGSDYDSSTDVYSLGIILFELCYPMFTGMERHIVFSKLRGLEFPEQWQRDVASSFPALHSLIKGMLSPRPKERPTADAVAQQIQSLLGEITILSLDGSRQGDDSVLLRVEATPTEGVLQRTMTRIQEAAPDVEIVQYGLRGGNKTAIMEFALSFQTGDDRSAVVDRIVLHIESSDDIRCVRQVSSGFRLSSREN